MTQLLIRNIDEETERRLRVLAGRNGVSPEEHVRQLIADATSSEHPTRGDSLMEVMNRLKAKHGVYLNEGEITHVRGGLREVDRG